MAAQPVQAASLLDLLAKVDSTTLDGIESRIGELTKELASLRGLQRIVQDRLGVVPPALPPKAPRTPRQPGAESATGRASLMPERRKAIALQLAKGPQSSSSIATLCNIPGGSITGVLQCEFFQQLPNGHYTLTPAGRRQFLEG